MAKVLICGDYAPTASNEAVLSAGSVSACVGEELAQVFQQQTLIAVNLETSLTDVSTPKNKRGQINRAAPTTCAFLKNAGVGLCFLANNHSIDNGNAGIETTLETLQNYQINAMGVGKNAEEAAKPFRITVDGKKLCFLNVANFEFNRPTDTQYGVNVYDPLETFDAIRAQKREDELLVLVYHGGVELYQYPTPQLQRMCRKFVKCGADVVLCQHSHCIGTYEVYQNGYILYGQGNFLFDDNASFMEDTAVLVQLDTQDGKISLVPVVKHGSLVKLADPVETEQILKEIEQRHQQILQPGFVQEQFVRFANGQKREICNALMGYNKVYKALNKLTKGKVESYIYNKKALMRMYNITNSPALQEVLSEVLSHYE